MVTNAGKCDCIIFDGYFCIPANYEHVTLACRIKIYIFNVIVKHCF